MMQHMVREGISLYDYELMTDQRGRRTVAFGHWAGIVGAWHALRMRGLRNGHPSVPTAAELGSYQGLLDSVSDLQLDAALFCFVATAAWAKAPSKCSKQRVLKRSSRSKSWNSRTSPGPKFIPKQVWWSFNPGISYLPRKGDLM